MTGRRFFMFLGLVFILALVMYLLSTPRGSDIPLIGIVDGNEVIISPQITGRMIKLTVNEGSVVKKGDLIAELDRKELEASLAAAKANVASLQAQVSGSRHNYSWTNDQTDAALMDGPLVPRAIFGVLNTLLIFPSGAVYPVEAFPTWLRWLSNVDPFPYTVHALRNLTLKSTGIEGIYRDVLILAGFSVVMITCSIALFKRQI
jgi:hypothetical protein